MLVANVVNSNKKGGLNASDGIKGSVFHLFYPDLNTSVFFDKDLTEPIIFGSKSVVMTWVKRLDELMNIKPTSKVKIHSYITSPEGYRRTDTYFGPIETIGKYIKHI